MMTEQAASIQPVKAIVTGLNGTVAPVLARRLAALGITVVGWNRRQVDPADRPACRQFIERERPDYFFHIATGSPAWAADVAGLCAEWGIGFLFTSTVSVFSDAVNGPFTVDHVPNATDEYGRYKIDCERRVLAANPQALIARIGWQIGRDADSNNMFAFLARTAAEKGQIEASTRWLTGCSFLEDTAEVLVRLMFDYPPDLYHVGGNPGLSFYEIVQALKALHQQTWQVVPTELPHYDNRLLDGRIAAAPITRRLGLT